MRVPLASELQGPLSLKRSSSIVRGWRVVVRASRSADSTSVQVELRSAIVHMENETAELGSDRGLNYLIIDY